VEKFDVVQVLQIGVIGLGFLLALLAYRLLSREQSRGKPNADILAQVRTYMIFSLLLCALGLLSEYLKDRHHPEDVKLVERFERTCAAIRVSRALDLDPDARDRISQWCGWSR
jgi:hypothetical protein